MLGLQVCIPKTQVYIRDDGQTEERRRKTELGKRRTRKAENGKRVKISVSASLMGSCWPDNSRARGKTEFQFGQNTTNLEQTLVLR